VAVVAVVVVQLLACPSKFYSLVVDSVVVVVQLLEQMFEELAEVLELK
jgi:hypothetical protein